MISKTYLYMCVYIYIYIYIYCRDTFGGPSPNCTGYWSSEPSIINL